MRAGFWLVWRVLGIFVAVSWDRPGGGFERGLGVRAGCVGVGSRIPIARSRRSGRVWLGVG